MKRNLNTAKETLYSSNLKDINKNLNNFITAKREAAEARAHTEPQEKEN